MVIQICTLKRDIFREVTLDVLYACLQEPDLQKRAALLLSQVTPTTVSSSDEVDVTVVINGKEDEESWNELKESLDL
jgi:hypothetical protein